MKKIIGLVMALALLAILTGCVPDSLAGLVNKPMDAALVDVLDVETRACFEAFDETPPMCMTVYYDQHYPEAIVFDKALIERMHDALMQARVTAKTEMASTDGYHRLYFVTEEGSQFGVRFENSVLCVGEERYELGNAKPFWELFKSTAEEYWDIAQQNAAQYASVPVTYLDGDMEKRIACKVASVDAAKSGDGTWLNADVRLALENRGDEPITKATARVSLLDFDGYVVMQTTLTADFSDAPLAPGETREYEKSFQTLDFSGGASLGGVMGALVTVERVSGVAPEVRLGEALFDFYNDPDIAAFAANFYDDMPASVTFRMNWYSPTSKTLTERDDIVAAFELLKPIVVTEKVDEYFTDSDTIIVFSYDDGREYAFCFNMHNLERAIPTHPYSETYRVTGGEDLWTLVDALGGQ